MFNSQFWQVLINLLFASFGNIQYHIFANCGKIRFIPDVGKPTFCHFWQLSKLPKLATSEAAKTGNFRSCQNWQLQKLPKLAPFKAAKTGNFRSCQNWQLQKLPKLATFRAASKMYHLLFASFGNIQYHIFANCGKIRFIPDVGKFSIVHILPNVDPTCCHFCQSIGFHILQLLGYCQSWNSLKSKVWQCKEFYFAIVGNL